jgi:hypothetical protein
MLLIYSPEESWNKEAWAQCVADLKAVCGELISNKQLIAASLLEPVATAASIRVRDGQSLIMNGPFATTDEKLNGCLIIEAMNIEQALDVASKLPAAKKGTVEVRPIQPVDGLPPEAFATPNNQQQQAFMFLCYDDEQAWSELGPTASRKAIGEAVALTHKLHELAYYVSAAPLQPLSTAKSVRIRSSKCLTTDGPFTETKEFLGGYYVITAPTLNEAINFASQHPGARLGTVEVRRIAVDLLS